MKLSTLILMWAGLAIAKKGGDKNQNANNNANDANNATSSANNATVSANNATMSANSTDSGNKNNGNNTSDNNGNNNNGSDLIQQQNGAPCINLDALNNVK